MIKNDFQPCPKSYLLIQLACVGVKTDTTTSAVTKMRCSQFLHIYIGIVIHMQGCVVCAEGFAL